MKRSAIIAVPLLLAATGCQFRYVETEVVTIDGERFVCTKTVNRISGNETEGDCYPVDRGGKP